MKEERSNLVCENEDLYGKVKEALTLSRKDSVKAKQFESEVEDLKDEFDRLRMAYEGTREYIENIEVRSIQFCSTSIIYRTPLFSEAYQA